MTTVLVGLLDMLKQANAVLEQELRRAVAGGHVPISSDAWVGAAGW